MCNTEFVLFYITGICTVIHMGMSLSYTTQASGMLYIEACVLLYTDICVLLSTKISVLLYT